jgi:hypothetical protein
MDFDTPGYAAPSASTPQDDVSLPMFNIERVSLQFSVASDFVAAEVANNVLILALSTGRILRIDLDSPADIDGSYGRAAGCGLMRDLYVDRYRSP